MNLADEIRRFISRLRGVVSLREFGAVLDGVTDDLSAVQRAAADTRYATLIVDGPCYVSAPVTIPASLPVRFDANGAFSGPVTYTSWTLKSEAWHIVGNNGEPAFLNSWTNYGAAPTYSQVAFYKDPVGVVHLKGLLKSGTLTASAFNLPAGYRPAENYNVGVAANAAFGYVLISANGAITPWTGSNVWFSLDGISFRAEQ